ncbi:MAG: type III glutamate--ammonia ligase [Rubrivivax sp.]|nr:type III glutamate--ammonia ligase [Rubrivivax sp.]
MPCSVPESLPLAETLRAQGVHTLLVQFTDLEGVAKGKLVPLQQLATVLQAGAGFAGPSITGTGLPRCGPRSEFYARADATTALPLPWWPGVARLVGDGFVDGQPFEACPRQVLRRQVARLAERGWRLETGMEPEFFLLQRAPWRPADAHDGLDKPSYDLKALPRQAAFLQGLAAALADCGFEVLQIDHEDAHGQYELNFLHDDVLATADRLMLFKLAAQALAEREGLVFSMMPKPFADQPGSGLHVHASLWRGEETMPQVLPAFVAGVLAHAAGLTALAAPTVNSYRRLAATRALSGTTWAPGLVAHGPNNRTALVRTLGDRFEWRLPDSSANPYLVSAGLIAAGLDGIERGLVPPPAVDHDLYEQPAPAGTARLPRTLEESCDALAADTVLTAALGPTLSAEFLRLKRAEHAEWSAQVSAWELDRYAERF